MKYWLVFAQISKQYGFLVGDVISIRNHPLFALSNRQRLANENPNCSFFKGGWADRYIALVKELCPLQDERLFRGV